MSLKIQEYLSSGKNSFDSLKEELGITVNFHPNYPLVILNYDQIESPKTHPIVRECRGLTLKSNSFDLVAKSFNRFFNWGEVVDEMQLFNFNNFTANSKEDGSLGLLYYYNGDWHFNTRNSFGLGLTQSPNYTWRELVEKALQVSSLSDLKKSLNPDFSYTCELVSPYNKVVRYYPNPQLYLLTVFDLRNNRELTEGEVREHYKTLKIPFLMPEKYNYSSIEEIKEYIKICEEKDPTFEGVVIRDDQNYRWKIKSLTYLAYHKMLDNGNIFNVKRQLPFILTNETDELIATFPEIKETLEENKKIVDDALNHAINIWSKYKDIQDQKEFALKVMSEYKELQSILFIMRNREQDKSIANLKKIFRDNPQIILKNLFNK